jgi:hypothetical protein
MLCFCERGRATEDTFLDLIQDADVLSVVGTPRAMTYPTPYMRTTRVLSKDDTRTVLSLGSVAQATHL